MKALFIGGTGTISTDVVALAQQRGWEITLLNRGSKKLPEGMRSIVADIHDEQAVAKAIAHESYDVVAQFIGYTAKDVERDIRLFQHKTKQYIFISSASAYQKPQTDYRITESTPLVNPFWEYSRNKIEAEEVLMTAYRTTGFPVTIVRPSHTYNGTKPPVSVSRNRCDRGTRKLRLIVEKRILPPYLQRDRRNRQQYRHCSFRDNAANQRNHRKNRKPRHQRNDKGNIRPRLNLSRQYVRNRAQQSRDRQNTSQKTAYDITHAMRLSFLQRANRLNSLRLRYTRFRRRTRPCHTSSNMGIAFHQSIHQSSNQPSKPSS